MLQSPVSALVRTYYRTCRIAYSYISELICSTQDLTKLSCNMAQYLSVDIQSLLPRASPKTADVASVGDKAPELPFRANTSYGATKTGTVIAFVRHCGCPFAEKEVRLLGEVAKQYPGIQIIVVQHSDEQTTKQWWQTVK